MKLVLSLVTFLATSSAFACIGFSGTWQCGENIKTSIQTELTADGWVIKDEGGKLNLLLNGVEHTETSPITYKYQGTCDLTDLDLTLEVLGLKTRQQLKLTGVNTMDATVTVGDGVHTIACTK